MHLKAACLGYAVPPCDFAACVHSSFTSAVNLLPEGGEYLLTLLSEKGDDLPQGIRLNSAQGFSFENLQQGELFTCRDGILSCEASNLSIDLRQAERWQCDLLALEVDMNDPSTLLAWQWVEKLLDEKKNLGNLNAGMPVASKEINEVAAGLIAATQRCDVRAADDCVADLIGLGPGLTPAGDDFLTGFFAGLWSSSGGRPERMRFLFELGSKVVKLSWRTNDISRTYLFHATRGQVSKRLTNLAEAIGRGNASYRVFGPAEASMQVGHGSGIQATRGLLMGLAA